ncbi:hypothetical protein COCOBI_10-0500 [Coccomyxa sp. Obi]|nr:hypothetical protein COCOBI_10-0500 [Coccomyxa sp. Obi]
MAGGEPPDVVNRWYTSGSGWRTRTGARSSHRTSQQGAESLCGDYNSEDGSCSGWPGTPRAAGNLTSPRYSRPVTPRLTGSAASPRHSQFRSPRGQSPRGHQQSPREPGPLSIAFNMPLPNEGGSIDSDEPHMASAVDSRNENQQHVQSQGRNAHAQRSKGRKVPLLPLSSLGQPKNSTESGGEIDLHQQPLQMSGAMFHDSTHAEQSRADLSHSGSDLTQDERQQSGTEIVQNATEFAVGSSSIGGDAEKSSAAVWSALEEAYCGSEDELQMSALQADTYESLASECSPHGRSEMAQSSGSTDTSFTVEGGTDSNLFIMEPEQEGSRISRAYSILGDVSNTLAQQNASALDASCTISTGTAQPASLERKTAEVSQQMMGLTVQDGTQQPSAVTSLSQPATSNASEAPGGTSHADLHNRPTVSRTQPSSEQLSSAYVAAQLEHPSPQQTPRVGLSAILDNAPDQACMLSNLPTLSSQQSGRSQHGDGLLWIGVNMLTADDVSARALAAAAAHPDAAESQHSGGAFSLTSDLSPESEDESLAHANQSNPAGTIIEGPTSAPDFGRTPLHRIPSSLTAQLKGRGPLGGRGLLSGAEDDRVGAFWPDGGSVRRVIVQRGYMEEEEEVGDFEDASDKFFGEMSLSSGSHSGTDAASVSGMHGSEPAGIHDVSNSNSSSSSPNVSLRDVGCSEERSMYEKVEDTQPSAVTSEAAEGMVSSMALVSGASAAEGMVPSMALVSGASAAEFITGVVQVMDSTSTQSGALDMTAPGVTQDAEQSEKACAGVGEVGTEAVDSATEAFAEQDAADMEPSSTIQDEDIFYELEKTVQHLLGSCTPPASRQRHSEQATPSPDRSCWSPSLGPMLEETVGLLFAATPVKELSGENDV